MAEFANQSAHNIETMLLQRFLNIRNVKWTLLGMKNYLKTTEKLS